MAIDYRSGVSIGLIIVYVPSLIIAILLATRHGFGRSSGWLFLITFSLARIIGSGFQLATISHPTISNYTAAAILTNIGFVPLELAALSLLSRLVADINDDKGNAHPRQRTFITTNMVKLVELILTVGMILGVIGGVNAGNNYTSTGKFVLGTESVAGTSLLLAVFALTILGVAIIALSMHHARRGEHRIFWALVASLPFLTVRLIYSALSTFSHKREFGLVGGSTTILLCVALLEELAVVIIYEGVGLTLPGPPPKSSRRRNDSGETSTAFSTSPSKDDRRSPNDSFDTPSAGHTQAQTHRQTKQQQLETGEKPKENLFIKIAKHLIFVRIIIWIVDAISGKSKEKKERRDAVEMS